MTDPNGLDVSGAILGPFVVVGTPLAGLLRRPLRQQAASVSVQRRAFASDRSAERDVPASPETRARMTRPLTATGMDECVAPQYLYAAQMSAGWLARQDSNLEPPDPE